MDVQEVVLGDAAPQGEARAGEAARLGQGGVALGRPGDALHGVDAGLGQGGQQAGDGATGVDQEPLVVAVQHAAGEAVAVGQVAPEEAGGDELAVEVVGREHDTARQAADLLHQELEPALQEDEHLLDQGLVEEHEALAPAQELVQEVGEGAAGQFQGQDAVPADQLAGAVQGGAVEGVGAGLGQGQGGGQVGGVLDGVFDLPPVAVGPAGPARLQATGGGFGAEEALVLLFFEADLEAAGLQAPGLDGEPDGQAEVADDLGQGPILPAGGQRAPAAVPGVPPGQVGQERWAAGAGETGQDLVPMAHSIPSLWDAVLLAGDHLPTGRRPPAYGQATTWPLLLKQTTTW